MSGILWTLLLALGIFAVAVAGMAIGVLVSNRRLRGSCGGLAGMRDANGKTLCDVCSHPSPDCAGEPLATTEHDG